ncbi:hypothetical protein RB195_022911 [Necator americanus]|uniref:Uncharacterized protein n=1 Tax=Necator americanus TaxID=51031 RepID=A0ABR1EHB4_NECAM
MDNSSSERATINTSRSAILNELSSRETRQSKGKLPHMEDKLDLVEPSLPPMQQQLGSLFRPPPFPALSSALQNFQAQG